MFDLICFFLSLLLFYNGATIKAAVGIIQIYSNGDWVSFDVWPDRALRPSKAPPINSESKSSYIVFNELSQVSDAEFRPVGIPIASIKLN